MYTRDKHIATSTAYKNVSRGKAAVFERLQRWMSPDSRDTQQQALFASSVGTLHILKRRLIDRERVNATEVAKGALVRLQKAFVTGKSLARFVFIASAAGASDAGEASFLLRRHETVRGDVYSGKSGLSPRVGFFYRIVAPLCVALPAW